MLETQLISSRESNENTLVIWLTVSSGAGLSVQPVARTAREHKPATSALKDFVIRYDFI